MLMLVMVLCNGYHHNCNGYHHAFYGLQTNFGGAKQTTNIGVLLELRSVPLQNFAIKAAIKNWEHIRTGKINDILRKNRANAILGGLPWISHIKSIL